MHTKKTFIAAVAIFLTLPVFAQQYDTAALFKEFTGICTGYRQLPLQVNMEYRKTSNLPLQEEDTSTFNARFYIQKEGAYVSFGDLEQLVNDSLGLMVMHSIKQMIIIENKESAASLLKAVTGPPLPDSVAGKFSEAFSIEKLVNNLQGVIRIKAKAVIPETTLPQQEIILKYDVKSGAPEQIETTSRALVPVGADVEIKKQLQVIVIKDKGRFVLKEDNASYVYKSITHYAGQKLPQVITDLVTTDTENNFIPAKAYESYLITQH